MVDYAGAADFFNLMLLLTRGLMPLTALVAVVIAFRALGRGDPRGWWKATVWLIVPWILTAGACLAVGLDPQRVLVHSDVASPVLLISPVVWGVITVTFGLLMAGVGKPRKAQDLRPPG